MAESFFATLECELIDRHSFKTQAEAAYGVSICGRALERRLCCAAADSKRLTEITGSASVPTGSDIETIAGPEVLTASCSAFSPYSLPS